jgi:hypothetical protein
VHATVQDQTCHSVACEQRAAGRKLSRMAPERLEEQSACQQQDWADD